MDLYYVHMDFFTDQLGEDAERRVWRTLERLHDAGRLRALGVCNYSVQALERLWKLARIKPTVLQCKFDPLHPGYQRLGSQPHEQAAEQRRARALPLAAGLAADCGGSSRPLCRLGRKGTAQPARPRSQALAVHLYIRVLKGLGLKNRSAMSFLK